MFQQFVDKVRTNGGATWHWVIPVPAKGFVVSHGPAFSRTVSADVLDGHGAGDVVGEFVEQHRATFEGGSFVGGWVDGGLFYLDAVEIISDRDTAIALGVQRNQISIYDLATGETINTGGTGE